MPVGLYIHLPFCRVHCTYCPFAVSTDIRLQDQYTEALIAEIGARANGEAVDSIFFGGGTPSRTSRENLIRIVAKLRDTFSIEGGAEFSIVANLYTLAIERFADAGFAQYEISNFARPGEECRHNLRYWRREEYLGFGIGAHSFLGDRRFANTRDIHAYIAGQREPVFAEELGEGEVRRETIFLGLRQARGINYEDFVRICGAEGIE